MSQTECQCPPKPYYSPGSLASGSNHEERVQRDWEAEHGGHHAAAMARLPPVWLDARQLGAFREELRRHLERNGDALMQITPHHLKALLDAAALADVVPERTQKEMDGALAALRRVNTTDGSLPQPTVQAVSEARDRLREAGARNLTAPVAQ